MITDLVLAAHGAGNASAANGLVRWHAARLAARGGFREVTAAFHDGDPPFEMVLDRLGARRTIVIPFFASAGHYVDRVLVAALSRNARWDPANVRVTPSVGSAPAFRSVVATAVRGVLSPGREGATGVLVVGHGTVRHPRSGNATDALARHLAARLGVPAAPAFLDQAPHIEAVAAAVEWDRVVVVPHLIGGGMHERADVRDRLASLLARRIVRFLPPVGRLPGITDLLFALAFPPAGTAAGGRRGQVFLVGAGPGDPGMLTVRGREVLARADVVLHDRLIVPAVLDLAPECALRVDVGKMPRGRQMDQAGINALLVEHARRGRAVVRLKGGDPFVFGRGGEELDACRVAGVPCEVVPGVSSAFAVPAAAGIPVTLRGVSRSVAIVTGQAEGGGDGLPFDVAAAARLDTIVVLMAVSALPRVAGALIAAGRRSDTPVACVQQGGWPGQRVVTGTLATISARAAAAGLVSPAVTVIGAVAARAATLFQPPPPSPRSPRQWSGSDAWSRTWARTSHRTRRS